MRIRLRSYTAVATTVILTALSYAGAAQSKAILYTCSVSECKYKDDVSPVSRKYLMAILPGHDLQFVLDSITIYNFYNDGRFQRRSDIYVLQGKYRIQANKIILEARGRRMSFRVSFHVFKGIDGSYYCSVPDAAENDDRVYTVRLRSL